MFASSDSYEVGWAAGFYEGEGSFSVTIAHRSPSQARSVTLGIEQNDRAPLDRFQRIVGCGRVVVRRHSATRRFGARVSFAYYVTVWADVQKLIVLLWPGLSDRRRHQIRLAIERYNGRVMKRKQTRTGVFVVPEELSS